MKLEKCWAQLRWEINLPGKVQFCFWKWSQLHILGLALRIDPLWCFFLFQYGGQLSKNRSNSKSCLIDASTLHSTFPTDLLIVSLGNARKKMKKSTQKENQIKLTKFIGDKHEMLRDSAVEFLTFAAGVLNVRRKECFSFYAVKPSPIMSRYVWY